MKKNLVFNTGPIISLTLNNLLWILKPLKAHFKGPFYITQSVEDELVNKPLATKKFKFEAVQVKSQIDIGVLKVKKLKGEEQKLSDFLENLMNSIFLANSQTLKIVQKAEVDTIALALSVGSSAAVIDERIIRIFIENPKILHTILEKRLERKISIDEKKLAALKEKISELPIIRSAELAVVAYEKGLFKKYIAAIPRAREELLEGILWGLKLSGCAISEIEINDLLKAELG